jgi:tol-pal system protein YbgF
VGTFLKKQILKKSMRLSTRLQLTAVLGGMILLSACAPAATGLAPSGALQQQLHDIRGQQTQQAQLVQQLQQQLTQLQQQLAMGEIIPLPPQQTPPMTDPAENPMGLVTKAPQQTEKIVTPIQFNGAQEVSAVAASASSYLAAFSNLAAGRWVAAETGFQTFIDEYSDHQYAPNARYWLANAQLSQGKTDAATSNLRQIIIDPRGQTKAPAAMLQLEQLYRRQKLTLQADEIAEQLRSRYPDSQEAQYLYRNPELKN